MISKQPQQQQQPKIKIKRAGDAVQLVEYVPSLDKALGPALAAHKLGVLVPACHPSAQEAEAVGSEIKVILRYLASVRSAYKT